ncbi:MAG TPA: protein-glutamate O-methyltransferase CheR [Polyangiales bacterium]|nr:protein-glutamate O-methyltransferase CheR [Polyangiales bacterium]
MTALRERPRESMINAVIEAMVTHESLFFRDERPFAHLADVVIPELLRARPSARPIRVWSAACSSGQEAYSVAMLVAERFPGWNWEIVGTDISEPIIVKARAGVFSSFEIKRGLTSQRIQRHFRAVDAQSFAINDNLRRMVRFETHNLLESALRFGQFDVVFCRNVLIYFDTPTKARVLDLIARQMTLGGTLFLGSADTVIGVSNKFTSAGNERGVYRPLAEASKVA